MLRSRLALGALAALFGATALVACGSTLGGGGYASSGPQTVATPAVGRPMTATAGASPAAAPIADQVAIPTAAPSERPGLGTAWGEAVYAPITARPFARASAAPWAVAVLRYNDEEGVAAQARYYGGALEPMEIYAGDGSIGISLVDESGGLLPGFLAGGQPLIVGRDGARYRIVVRNGTSARFEIVASVDGLDVLDGKAADPARRGYILDPYGQLVIDGFRQTDQQVAAFRFGAVADSYAARTDGGGNVGVVGVAIFAE
ncbi:MAG: hypothetical protein K8W52_47565, partial [Deltaproteobacteria bacterium]|nr:hypothetical protein [Deltaproteobacteria bacterium]